MSTRDVRVSNLKIPVSVWVLLGLLAVWESTHWIFSVNSLILPAPSEIIAAFLNNFIRLFQETGITLIEAVLGFILGSLTAYILAIVFVHNKEVQDAIYPYAVALKSTPLIAIAPLLVIWFGNGMLSKIVMSALVAFFPVLVNSVDGLTSVNREAFDLMRSLSASRLQILLKVRIPSSLSYVFSALKISSSLAVVGAVIGEFTGATRGIGHVITTSSYYLETPLMFAAIIMISVGGILFFWAVGYIEKKVVFWQSVS